MSEWQPIETAPKDGETPVLTWYPKAYQGKGGHYVMLWQDGKWWAIPGAFELKPTHWMPLPSPPSTESAA